MLRRCRLCARQLSSSRSLALSARHRPKDGINHSAQSDEQQQQQQPVASTSKHVFVESSWTSTLPRCLQRRRNHSATATATLPTQDASENRFEHDFSKTLLKKSSGSSGSNSSPTSLWKGKARAIEPDVPSPAIPSQAQTEEATAGSSTKSEDSASAEQPIPSAVQIDPSIAAIPEVQASMRHFDKLIQEGDFVACLLAIVESCLQYTRKTRPYAVEEVRYRIQRLHSAFTNHPRTSSLDILLSHQAQFSQSIPKLEFIVALAFRAVLEQDSYRLWRVRLQQLLKRIIPVLLEQSFESADACLAAVMAEFKTRRRWESIEQIGRLAKSTFGQWTSATLNPYLEAIDHLDRHNLAPTLESLDPSIQPFPEHRTYDYLLKCHLSNRNLSAAKAVLDAMIAAGLPPNQTTFEFVYSGYRPLGGYSTFLDDAKQLKLGPSWNLVNQVLESLIREEGVTASISAIQSLPKRAEQKVRNALAGGSQPSPVDFVVDTSTASHQYPVARQAETTSEMTLQESPNRSTFGLMVRAYSSIGSFEEALDTYTDMLEAGHQPNAFTQSALVAAYRTPAARLAASPAIEARMPELLESKELSAEAQSKVLRAKLPSLLQEDGLAGIVNMLASMNDQEIRLDDRSVSIIFNYLAKSGAASPSVLSRLLVQLRRAHGSSYKVSDVNILIQEFMKQEAHLPIDPTRRFDIQFAPDPAHDPSAAAQFASIVENLSLQGSRPDAYTMMLIMKRYADNGGSPRRLWDFFKFHFLEQGFKPNAHHISALMVAFVKAGDVYGARRAMDRGFALGVQPGLPHLTILMEAFVDARNPQAARQILREMDDRQLPIDTHVLATLASYEAKVGNLQEILALEKEARRRTFKENWPNVVFETLKFRCRLQRRDTHDALISLKHALEHDGLVPDQHLLRAVLGAWRGVRSARNRVGDGKGRTKQDAGNLVELARNVKNLVADRLQQQMTRAREEHANLDKQMKQLLKSLNMNREIVGDYNVDEYNSPMKRSRPPKARRAEDTEIQSRQQSSLTRFIESRSLDTFVS